MKKYLILFFLLIYSSGNLQALIVKDNNNKRVQQKITLTGFADYAPIGKKIGTYSSTYQTIFQRVLDKLAQEKFLQYTYEINPDYKSSIAQTKTGKIDIVLGVYFDTYIYNEIEIVYPAVLANPISVIMLPQRISEIRSIEGLKKLKGGISQQEFLSDFVAKQITNFQVTSFENSDQMFRALFRKEIDYIFASYYWGTIEISNLGLENQVTFSKQSLWDMPIFIGVPRMSENYKSLVLPLEKILNNAEMKKNIQEDLIKMINNIKRDNSGVNAPSYATE